MNTLLIQNYKLSEMKRIEPYASSNFAMKDLDNGGRFYNLWTKADDGVISSAELAKVGGLFNDKQKMILYLQMALSKMEDAEKSIVLNRLDENLKIAYNEYHVEQILDCTSGLEGKQGQNVIIKGIPRRIESKSDFNAFIMVPIMAGSVTTFSMIPIIDKYEIYEIHSESGDNFLIAHTRETESLPEQVFMIGGVVKELKSDNDEDSKSTIFIEAVYYCE